jgi:NADPH:quinone reductase-like Zn-dependent oxidoreductase
MLGSPRDGVLCELALFQETGLVRIPDRFSWEEAACFPCAGVTAWNALFGKGEPVRAGQTVLVLGTGGVSLFALQLARMAGAQVIVTSSSDEKLAAVLPLGVQHRINYRRFPEWQEEVLKITGGRGVDCVVEVGGTGTLGRSFQTGGEPPNPGILMLKLASLHGIRVGSRAQFEALVAAYESNDARPVIGRRFGFDEVLDAYRVQAAGDFIGKIVIAM